MPKATLQKTFQNNSCLYDDRLNWAAKGLMMTLINHEQHEGEIVFADSESVEWTETKAALLMLERYGYIYIERRGFSEIPERFDIFIS